MTEELVTNPVNGARSVGAQLRVAREARGLTRRDLAAITKIQASHLEYLEADRFEELPAPAYTRGFLKSYAKELRLDTDEMMEAYTRQTGSQVAVPSKRISLAAAAVLPDVGATDAHGTVATSADGKFADPSRVGRVMYAIAIALLVVGLALSVLVFGGDATSNQTAAVFQQSVESDGWRPAPDGQDDWRTYREN